MNHKVAHVVHTLYMTGRKISLEEAKRIKASEKYKEEKRAAEKALGNMGLKSFHSITKDN